MAGEAEQVKKKRKIRKEQEQGSWGLWKRRASERKTCAARKNATGPKKHGPGRPTGRQARSPEQLLKAVAAILGYSKAMAVLDEAERDALAML